MVKREDGELDPEFMIPDDILRRNIGEAYNDPRPGIPAEEVFERLRRRPAERMKAKDADRPSR